MRLSRTDACLVLAVVYIVLVLAISGMKPGSIPTALGILISVPVLMLVQLGFVVSLSGAQLRIRDSALVVLSSGILFAGVTLALGAIKPASHSALVLVLSALRNLLLMAFAGSLGYTVSFILREPGILLPVTLFAALVDCWSVAWGPLSHVLEKRPEIAEAASVHMPTAAVGVPSTMIGMGDFLFLALFFGVLYRFSMNVSGAFWLSFALLTVSMLVVIHWINALPALVPMSIAVMAANVRQFRLTRKELLATLYVGILLLVLLIGSGVFLFRR